ncbi:ImmA/IrrE family metallo-endopeptidase [Pseudomonas aeruginosa]|uniref:ImmA/IrrE family metallo-endopeptidase n=1 Tax=Pseudomonas aeruginosa TaxID=287 RepID=UPI0009372044|nr:ImmA/IrrE family metallo-endopeptidase [Pseudomonas aeruginosa]EKJ8514535.1 ImmA/IrrE family metallo-endopeptidase [Pseudomonas aeruginosa]ELK7308630.1 ImmA/IrrE family metallo-endopeptidase [Pseudomonas aeruginosa]ELP0276349.1 ImmA/IrrE family metallo-endopeptidase [Pseudomonas aeruginosa]MBG4805752.1 ImmA/IrrE family metallo-endopeptidase [Pseudomonas aeruginosa]MBG5029277.1 ImmA/IrrE family metallo-endopeptidase [Pseudomonas aeruginosa]
MSFREIALRAALRASEVLEESGAMDRTREGYSRIDPFLIAAGHRVLVMLKPLDKLLGAFIGDTSPGIILNNQRSAGLIHMTCAHELGHYFMEHGSNTDQQIFYSRSSAEIEQEADQFGYNLLIPRDLISHVMRRKRWTRQCLLKPLVMYQLSLRLGVSYEAVAWSLLRYKVFDSRAIQRLLQTKPAEIKKAILGKAPSDARKEVWLLDDFDKDAILEPRVDDQIIVRLKSNASAGYLWRADKATDVQGEGFQLQPITVPSQNSKEQLAFGGADTMDYALLNGAAFNTELTPFKLSEHMPWQENGEVLGTFSSATKFEGLETGLAASSKKQYLEDAAS